MTDTSTVEETGRVTRRDLAEGKIEKVMTERTTMVPISDFGLRFENAFQMGEAAKLMATAGPMLPEWLQGNVGGCWGIILRATELGISPLTLANWSYLVENKGVKRVAYESQFYHAIVEARAPIKESLQHEILGEGEERRCRVWATFKGETRPKEFMSETLAHLRPAKNEYGKTKGSPLWDRKPALQLFYDASRDWARIHCPHILGGVYARDELEEAEQHIGPDHAKDVSPTLRERLRGPVGEGFEHTKSSIEASIAAATTVDHKKSGKATALAGPADGDASVETASSSQVPPAHGDGAVTTDQIEGADH
jgi:RecT family